MLTSIQTLYVREIVATKDNETKCFFYVINVHVNHLRRCVDFHKILYNIFLIYLDGKDQFPDTIIITTDDRY